MLKRPITYEDFNGNIVTEDFYFNLSKAELVEMELSSKDGFADLLQKIIAERDGTQLIAQFKNIILQAYGVKSEDGKRFTKSAELRDEFYHSAAYQALFIELIASEQTVADFILAVIPKDLSENVSTQMGLQPPAANTPSLPPPPPAA